MKHAYPTQGVALQDHAALIEAAKLRAERLRREAMAAMWTSVARALRGAWHRLEPRTRAPLRAGAAQPTTCAR